MEETKPYSKEELERLRASPMSVAFYEGFSPCIERLLVTVAARDATIDTLKNLLRRFVINQYPCANCTFALAAFGKYDEAFGVGAPLYCGTCAPREDGDFRRVDRDQYRPLVQHALELID